MSNTSEDIQAAGSDTCPPMLDRTDYESWVQRIRLYCRGKENGHHILSSIDEGPFKMGTCRDAVGVTPEGATILGPERPRTYDDLDDNDKARFNAYVHATNILVNDMRHIRMTMPNIQLNSKFVNNMTPKWDRFVTAFKLNKGLKETNHEQLYAYLKQHEKHAAQDIMIIEILSPPSNDPLYSSPPAPLQSPYAQPTQYPQFVDNSQLDTGYTPIEEMTNTLTKQVTLLTQSFRAHLPQTNNQLRTTSNTRNQVKVHNGRVIIQTVQGRQNQNQRNNAQGAGAATTRGVQNRDGNANQGQAKQIKCYTYSAQENGAVLDEEELLFLAGDHANTFDVDVDEQPVRDMAQNDNNIFQADECDAFDSDIDDEPTAQTIFMANLSLARPVHLQAGPSHASTLSEVRNLANDVDHVNVNHEEHEIHNKVKQPIIVDLDTVKISNSNIIPYEQYLKNNKAFVVLNDVSLVLNDDSLATELAIYIEQVEMALGYQNPYYLNKAKRAQPALYDGHEILKTNHVPAIVPTSMKDVELADISREKMIEKVKDPEYLVKKRAEALKAQATPLKVLPPATVNYGVIGET
ncbi:hypothetical protein Tco_1274058 [Tanacetum coccineum]